MADLAAADKQTGVWDGIRNFQARNFLRDKAAVGDRVFIYHCQCSAPGVYGIARICRAAYPDPAQFDPQSPYFDPKSKGD
ncbi:MAG TPA: EVE domain-containing protein, partial [Cellvibrionaceae bacterium]|nr:EVE domain-containing protein [Cellvibrionaceae bacterium]